MDWNAIEETIESATGGLRVIFTTTPQDGGVPFEVPGVDLPVTIGKGDVWYTSLPANNGRVAEVCLSESQYDAWLIFVNDEIG